MTDQREEKQRKYEKALKYARINIILSMSMTALMTGVGFCYMLSSTMRGVSVPVSFSNMTVTLIALLMAVSVGFISIATLTKINLHLVREHGLDYKGRLFSELDDLEKEK